MPTLRSPEARAIARERRVTDRDRTTERRQARAVKTVETGRYYGRTPR